VLFLCHFHDFLCVIDVILNFYLPDYHCSSLPFFSAFLRFLSSGSNFSFKFLFASTFSFSCLCSSLFSSLSLFSCAPAVFICDLTFSRGLVAGSLGLISCCFRALSCITWGFMPSRAFLMACCALLSLSCASGVGSLS